MAIPLYGQNKAGSILNNLVNNDGYREITVITAADDSHTLAASDGGLIFITAALASGAVIKLPEATSENNLITPKKQSPLAVKRSAPAVVSTPRIILKFNPAEAAGNVIDIAAA